MNHPSDRPFWTRLCFKALAWALLFLILGCATDPEYARKLAMSRTDWTGQEIVGIWVGKADMGRKSVLLRSDGTGIYRIKSLGLTEADLKWHYAGAGVWEGVSGTPFILNYNGHELLWKTGPGGINRQVLVRAENETAVTEYLKKRE